MSTQLVKVERQTAQGIIVAEDQVYGPVVFFNTNLITEKTVAIMRACLDDLKFEAAGHGLLSIVIRDDGFPRGEIVDDTGTRLRNTWRFYPESKSAICNLLECINSAIVDTQNDKPKIECYGIFGLVWKNIIQGFFHEAHHAHSFITDESGKLWDAMELESDELCAYEDTEEDAANNFARGMIFKLVKAIDMEPEFSQHVADLISITLDEEIDKINADANAPEHLKRWAMVQEYLRDNGGVYYDPRIPGTDTYTIHLKSFKSLMHHLSRDAENDPSWNMPTIGNKVTIVQQPLTATASAVTSPLYAAVADGLIVSDDDDVPDFEAIQGASAPGFEGVAKFTAAIQTAAPVAETTNNWTPPWVQQNTTAAINPTTGGYNPNVAINVGQNAYSPINLPAGINAQDVINRMYMKIFMHIFRDCRYNPRNLAMPFEMAGNICTPIILDPHEALFVKEMTCIINGQTSRGVVSKGEIVGYMTDKEGRLPGYDLTLSTPDGQQIKRRFIPQNPNKMKKGTTQFSETAVQAQQGNCILWIIDPMTQKNSFGMRVYNGVVQKSVNGQWV